MTPRFTSLEGRRWIAACALAACFVALQIVHVARVTGGAAATAREVPVPGGPAPAVPATPSFPVAVSGAVVGVGDGWIGVRETGAAAPVSFTTGAGSIVTRDGRTAPVSSLRPGDALEMTVDGRTGRVLQLSAEPAAASRVERVAAAGPIAAIALVAAALLLVARRRGAGWTVRPVTAARRLLATLENRAAPRGAGFVAARRTPACRA